MALRNRIMKLEQEADTELGTLRLPDGQVIRYEPKEMLGALVAAIDGHGYRLLPYLRQIDTNEGMPGLIRALEGSRVVSQRCPAGEQHS